MHAWVVGHEKEREDIYKKKKERRNQILVSKVTVQKRHICDVTIIDSTNGIPISSTRNHDFFYFVTQPKKIGILITSRALKKFFDRWKRTKHYSLTRSRKPIQNNLRGLSWMVGLWQKSPQLTFPLTNLSAKHHFVEKYIGYK